MKINVGDYVRTDDGLIGKVVSEPYEYKDSIVRDIDFGNNDIYNEYEMYQTIIKSSKNIMDLIEVGDYVNGFEVLRIDKECNLYPKTLKCQYPNNIDYFDIFNEDIKSIVTKEQFSQMEYRINE